MGSLALGPVLATVASGVVVASAVTVTGIVTSFPPVVTLKLLVVNSLPVTMN